MLVVFYALENFINFFQKTGWSKTPLNLHMVSKGYIATKIPLKEGLQKGLFFYTLSPTIYNTDKKG